MSNLRFLPQPIHAVLDYAVAVTLIAVPFILDFKEQSSFAHWLSVIAGIGLFVYSLATDYSLGAVKAITIRQHLGLDAAAALLFIVLAIFADFSTEAAVFYAIIGIAVMAVVFVTDLNPPQKKETTKMGTNAAEYGGLCPVALSEGVDFPGTEEFVSNFQGKKYLFGSADGKAMFDQDANAVLSLIKQ